ITKQCGLPGARFEYGLFEDALKLDIVDASFFEKYLYCLWWGFRNLSSYGQNLQNSTYAGETIFCILICIMGLVFFSHLIGNMQTYLQSMTVRLEEWRVKRRDIEEWMRHRQLPLELQERVRRFFQYKWLATRGVDEESILQSLPLDLRREIQRHLCLALVRRVRCHAICHLLSAAGTVTVTPTLNVGINCGLACIAGALLLADGRAAAGRHLRAAGVVAEHQGRVHRAGGRPRERDALHHPRRAGELDDGRRPDQLLQLHHAPAGGLLRRGAPDVGADAQPEPQLPAVDAHGAVGDGGGGVRAPRRGPQVRGQPVQAPPQQAAAARVPVLLPPVAELGRLLRAGRLEAVQEEEARQGAHEAGGAP
uniref:Ion transport domain-containing protein n=2 Tax=Triticinae TaxID=1648030 RepID=A0A453HI68_AEGTS